MKLIISFKNKKDGFKCRYLEGDELDCAFCKYKNTDKCIRNKK